jgi:hypothetical protein
VRLGQLLRIEGRIEQDKKMDASEGVHW